MLILEDHAEEFSLVLLDIVMPNMDGFAFLKAMRASGWLDFLPVIMISSEYTAENIENAFRLGASDIIQRPYNERVICHRIANTIALAGKQRELSNALVNEVIQENETTSAMVSILSHIVETRNGESGDHVRNIRCITKMLLEELMKRTNRYAFSKEEILLICTAASLHYIGKMTIPEEILNKPGKLTDEEFRIMKGHSMAGAEMVDALRRQGNTNLLFQLTYEICRWHHERYDGRGYPDGLKGEEIPIAAQIVSLADVYDALVSARCYKPARTPEQAYRMIVGGECGAFNPLLLECLSGIFNQLRGALILPDSEAQAAGGEPSRELIEDAIAHLHDNGLVTSEKIMQTLSRERLRLKFFFNESCPAFYYTVSPPVLHYNRAGMALFGLDKPVIVPNEVLNAHEKYDRDAANRLRRRLAAATNEHPLVTETIQLRLPGEQPRQYRCELQTIWESADAAQFAEVTGRLIPLDGEPLPAVADAGKRGETPAIGGEMTSKEALYLIGALKFMVYNVRLVDPADSSIVEIDSSGRLFKSGAACYQIWKQCRRCANCTSMKCLTYQKEFSKIVFLENEAFHVISQYVRVDGTPLVLEMLTRITDDALIGGDGERLPSRSISDMQSKLYLDPITHAHNRRYYNAKAQAPEKLCALAILDVDHFGEINGTYGRAVGDDVLMRIAQTAGGDIRKTDVLVRYYGDEFVIMFTAIDPDALNAVLRKIAADIAALSFDGMEEDRRVTVSIGGAMGPDLPAALLKRADEMLKKPSRTGAPS